MKIYHTSHFYNNSPLRTYLAGEPMLEKPKIKDNSPAVILSASLVKKIKKVRVVDSFCVHGTRVSEKVLEMIQTPTEMRTFEVNVNFNFFCL